MDVTIACICPALPDGSSRHETDTLTYRDALDWATSTAIRKDLQLVDEDGTAGDRLAVVTHEYMVRGLLSWTIVDARGKPVPPSRAAVDELLLTRFEAQMDVSEAVEELYNPQVLLPLVVRASRSSGTGPTGPSTSAPTASPKRPRKRSSRSSTSTTRTDGTGTIMQLPDGDSRQSRSATSVA